MSIGGKVNQYFYFAEGIVNKAYLCQIIKNRQACVGCCCATVA